MSWAYWKQVLIAFDHLIDAVLFFDGNHCRTSYESELERTQLPPSMRG